MSQTEEMIRKLESPEAEEQLKTAESHTEETDALLASAKKLEDCIPVCKDLEKQQKELEMLPMGALTMTLEVGIRFLKDYLDGDLYFRTAYPEHNLVRARTQLALVADMQKKWEDMNRIVKEVTEKVHT